MKVLILVNQMRTLRLFWKTLLLRMRQKGHTVLCLVPDDDTPTRMLLEAEGIHFRFYPLDRKGYNPFRDIQTFLAIRRILREEEADILFAATIKPVIYGCFAARVAGCKRVFAVITGLGYAFEADTWAKRFLRKLVRTLYRLALPVTEKIFFQNTADAEAFSQAGLQLEGRAVFCAGVGVDTVRFALESPVYAPVTFVLVARLLWAKGIEEYIKAARVLASSYPNARFWLLGPEEEGVGAVSRECLQEWLDEGNVLWLGAVDDVRPVLAQASVVVLPSWREGMPTAILEAMSMGRAVVVSDVPGCREVVAEGINGFLVPPRDAYALALGMEKFLRTPDLIARMGAEGRRRAVEEFDASCIASYMMEHMGL